MAGTITPSTGAAHARIAGVGAYRPRRVVPLVANDDAPDPTTVVSSRPRPVPHSNVSPF